MKYEEFKLQVVREVERIFARKQIPVSVIINPVQKNNGICLDGLCIIRTESAKSNINPTIYLNGYYNDFENARPLDEIISAIIKTDSDNQPSNFDISQFVDFDKVKDYIHCKVINTALNDILLSDVPHFDMLDLSVIFYVVTKEFGDEGTITIHNNHLNIWNISEQELFEIAKSNNHKQQYCITDMLSILNEILLDNKTCDELLRENLEEEQANNLMYVVTNESKIYGASAILEEQCLNKVSKIFHGSFYVLPSSLHEVIVITARDTNIDTVHELKNIVTCINREIVSTEDYLSDNIYLYDTTTKKLIIVG